MSSFVLAEAVVITGGFRQTNPVSNYSRTDLINLFGEPSNTFAGPAEQDRGWPGIEWAFLESTGSPDPIILYAHWDQFRIGSRDLPQAKRFAGWLDNEIHKK